MSDCKLLAERLTEAGLLEDRLIPVRDGEKASVVNHHDSENRHSSFAHISGNYGVYAGADPSGERWLIDMDVDDYEESAESDGLEAVNDLPTTLSVKSPHTDGESGGHRYYLITGDGVDEQLHDALGVYNPIPSWGEVRVRNQYVVGPGSQLDGCSKEWCDECSTAKGGRYEIATDAPIAEIDVADLLDVLRASGYESASKGTDSDDRSGTGGEDSAEYTNEFGTSLAQIREWDEKIDKLLSRIKPSLEKEPDDDSRSGYDMSAATKLLYWRFDESDIASILRRYRDRDKLDRDDYVERTIANARQKQTEQCDRPRSRDPRNSADREEAKLILKDLLRKYEHEDEPEVDNEDRHKIWWAVAELGKGSEYTDRVADLLNCGTDAVERQAERGQHVDKNGRVVVEDGKTWYLAGTPLRRYELLNFELDVRSFLEVEQGPLRAEVEATLPTGESFWKKVEPKVFNDKAWFDDELLGESFGTTLSVPNAPGGIVIPELLDAIRMWVHHQDAPRRRGVRHMGVHGDEFAVPGATLRRDGWLDDPETVYLERETGPERRVSVSTDSDEYDADDVREILESLPYTRDVTRFLPVLGWFYAAPFRTLLDDLGQDGEFNHLGVTGGTGSGKTASLSYLWRCFGMSGEPFSVDSSKFAQIATFSSTSSIPLWFDEYKPSEIQGYKLDRFHDLLRKATRGAYAERGNKDRTTDSYKIKAPCVVSGEQAIQGPAERRRTVMTQFRDETTAPGSETAERFKTLVGAAQVEDGEVVVGDGAPTPEDHALAYYRYVVGADRDTIRNRWHDGLKRAHEVAGTAGVANALDDLEVQGLQTVVFGFETYRAFAKSVGADTDALPSEADLKRALRHIIDRIGPEGKRKSHADRFVELFGRAATAGYVERGTHFEIVREGEPTEELRINLPRANDALSKYAREYDIGSEDLLNDHKDYRDRFRELLDQPDSYVESVMQYTPGVSKCTGISTLKAMNKLEFDRVTVADGTIDDAEEESSASDTDASPSGGTAADGGSPPDDATGKVVELIRNDYEKGDKLTAARVAGETDLAPETARDTLNTIQAERRLLGPASDGWQVL